MKISFLVNALPQQLAENQVSLASTRYRAIIPARELGPLGIGAEVRTFIDTIRPDFDCDADLAILQQPKLDVCAFRPVIDQYWRNIDLLQRGGRPLLLDVSDYKFGADHDRQLSSQIGPEKAAFYSAVVQELYRRCDGLIAPTDGLAALLRNHLPAERPIHVIPDPVEVARDEARFAPGRPLRLLWFGYFGGHAPIMQRFLLQDLDRIAAIAPFELSLLCEPQAVGLLSELAGPALQRHAVRTETWSVAALETALQACDLVVLPFAMTSMLSTGKSNNRALQALYAGRYVVAHPIDSYRLLSDFCGVDAALPEAIAAALADPAGTLGRLRRGQEHVARHYGPAAIGNLWAAMARQSLSRQSQPLTPAPAGG